MLPTLSGLSVFSAGTLLELAGARKSCGFNTHTWARSRHNAMIEPLAPEDFWQTLLPPGSHADPLAEPHSYIATLPDGRQLPLPIRARDDGTGLASLIVNQASFEVVETLAELLANRLREYGVELVVGMPTLGLTLAAAVARHLGHSRYLPLGTSPKFWYRRELSVPIASVTTSTERRLYIDPRLLALLDGRRIALIDDVISSGRSIVAGIELLTGCGSTPTVIGAAMLQGRRWEEARSTALPQWRQRTVGVFATPVLHATETGWTL
jgi:adenine/guanine phosphoribosyltransferase-like PRPP-binding protein